MRVAAFTGINGPDDVTIQETGDPTPESGEVVLDVAACSINRHDLWILEGDSAMVDTDDLPFVSGLDVAGEVAETGADVDSVSVGDRVVLCPNQTCGVCRYCREGPENLCEQFSLYHGGLAEKALIEDVDTTNLTHEYGEDGGPGRTLVFWQIYNHSSEEILLKHKHIGEDQIAYNRDANPLHVDNFGPGWRTENWEEIAEDTRIRYVSCIEIPVRLGAVKVNGYCSDVHNIEITDNMFFPKSEAPVKVDI